MYFDVSLFVDDFGSSHVVITEVLPFSLMEKKYTGTMRPFGKHKYFDTVSKAGVGRTRIAVGWVVVGGTTVDSCESAGSRQL